MAKFTRRDWLDVLVYGLIGIAVSVLASHVSYNRGVRDGYNAATRQAAP